MKQPPSTPAPDLFSDKADLYAEARPRYPEGLFAFLADCVAERRQVWDCATGNGQAAHSLAKWFDHVEASDLSAQQIQQAFKADNINYSVQVAEQTKFASQQFDLVTVAQALHWFDYARFWPEVKRVLKSGGVFAAWGYDWFSIDDNIDAVLQTHLHPVIKPYWASQNQLLWDSYRDIDFPFEKIQTPPFEMAVEWNLSQFLDYVHTWSATRRCMQAQGAAFFDTLAKEAARVWGDAALRKPAKMNFHLVVGRNVL